MTNTASPLDRIPVWSRAGVLAGVLTLATVLILIAFAWPTSRSEPRNLPVVVAPAAATQQIAKQLEAVGANELFDLAGVSDEAAARSAIANRDAFGAILIGPAGPRVLKAGAASPAAAQILDQLAATLATGKPPAIAQEVSSPAAGDPRGSAFATAVLPLTLSALIIGAAFGMMIRPRVPRLVGVLTTSIIVGICFTVVLDSWLGILAGAFVAEALTIALVLAAVASTVSGLVGLVGASGVGACAGVFVLLGVPLAGLTAPWQALPDFWGEFGRFLPAGAGGDLLRRLSFFPTAPVGFPLLVLVGWLALGVCLGLSVWRGSHPNGRSETGSTGSSIDSSSTEPTPINAGSSSAASSGRNGSTVAR
jgi:hypothetical protein